MTAAKPDITGQIFGWLKVLGQGQVVQCGKKPRRLWRVECLLCGKIIEVPRGDIDKKQYPRKSCGCARSRGLIDNNRRPMNITGQRFGELIAVHLTGEKIGGKPSWLMQCDCGRTCKRSLSQLRQKQHYGYRIHCGDLIHQPGLHYPPTPTPYPEEAWAIVAKYLWLTQPQVPKFDSRIQDERMDRLLRAAWIITYRRWQGEQFSEAHERAFICKHVRFSDAIVRLKRCVESGGYSRYTFTRYKRKGIGSMMTESNIISEVVVPLGQTQPEATIFKRKRLKFRRC